MTLMPVGPAVEYKSTVCCATELAPGMVVGSAISGAVSTELDSPTLDCWRPKARPRVLKPNLWSILGICLGARDYLARVVEESLVHRVGHLGFALCPAERLEPSDWLSKCHKMSSQRLSRAISCQFIKGKPVLQATVK